MHEFLYMSVGAAILCRFWSYSWRRDMDKSELVRFARVGAAARLAEIEQERQAILREFPDLRRARPDASEASAKTTTRGKRGARGGMSAAQRKEVSERMRKYWAARRGDGAQKAAKPAAAKTATKRRAPRKMSAAARKRIAAAQKARWAEWRKKKGAAA
jgi:hypothetical protein